MAQRPGREAKTGFDNTLLLNPLSQKFLKLYLCVSESCPGDEGGGEDFLVVVKLNKIVASLNRKNKFVWG